MVDKNILFYIFQVVIFDYCNSEEQMILKDILYGGKLEITNLFGVEGLTDNILKTYSKVKFLDIIENNNVTDEGIKHMNLKVLISCGNPNITDEGIKYMDLIILIVDSKSNIRNKCIKHMTNCKLYK